MKSRKKCNPHTPPKTDRLLLVLSDIEMGPGGVADDFPHSDWLADFILSYNEGEYKKLAIDLVLNGDIFDLLKTPYMGDYPRHITSDVALGKMSTIAAAHPKFFEGIRAFLRHEEADRRVHFIVGNHDAEVLFPEVQNFIRSLCGNPSKVLFPGFEMNVGLVHIEHGHQYDPPFQVDPDELFVDFQGEEVLNIAWGSVALLDTIMQYQSFLYMIDRLKPRDTVFELMPEVKEMLVDSFWQYWTQDYWKGFLTEGDPTKKLSWGMVKETVSRMSRTDTDASIDESLYKKIEDSDQFKLYVLGHKHQQGIWSYGDRKVLQAGCIRNEYMMENEGKTLRTIPKSFVEVYMKGERPIRSNLIEIEAPPTPRAYLPNSIFDILPAVRKIIAARASSPENEKAREEQERKEAAQKKE
ncbi:hypothetical protein KAI87_07895 [Myxococcota bacterium]|nr:hypothetical protein [Myxococcota bacterium]